MDNTDNQRANRTIGSETLQDAVHSRKRRFTVGMGMPRAGNARYRFEKASDVYDPQQDQHQPDRQFHTQANSWRNDEVEKDNRSAHDKNRQCVPDAPKCSNPGRLRDLALAAHDCGHGDHVIGIGGVAHPEEESECNDGEKADHRVGGFRTSLELSRTATDASNVESLATAPPEHE